MKKVVALLALMAFMPNAYADGSEVTHSGDYRVRFNNFSNQGGVEEKNENAFQHDFRWNVDFKKNDKFSGHLTLLHRANWGVDFAKQQNQHREDATTQQDALRVMEAYGTWMASDELSFKFGRGAFTLADGSLVHDGYNDNPNAFDGIMGTYDASFGRVSFFGVKGFQLARDTGALGDPEINFWGLSYDVKGLPDAAKMVNIHVLKVSGSETTTVASHNDMKYGLVFKGEAGGADYRLTYEGQGGDRKTSGSTATVDQKGSMIDAEVGFTLPAVMNMRFFVVYHNDSGDTDATDTENGTYDKFFYNAWDTAGAMRLFEWGNLSYIQAGLTMNATDSIEAGLKYTMFTMTESKGATLSNGGFALAADTTRTKSDLGNEIDLWATKKYDEGFHIMGRYSMFTPDDTLFSGNKETVSELFVEAQMMF